MSRRMWVLLVITIAVVAACWWLAASGPQVKVLGCQLSQATSGEVTGDCPNNGGMP